MLFFKTKAEVAALIWLCIIIPDVDFADILQSLTSFYDHPSIRRFQTGVHFK